MASHSFDKVFRKQKSSDSLSLSAQADKRQHTYTKDPADWDPAANKERMHHDTLEEFDTIRHVSFAASPAKQEPAPHGQRRSSVRGVYDWMRTIGKSPSSPTRAAMMSPSEWNRRLSAASDTTIRAFSATLAPAHHNILTPATEAGNEADVEESGGDDYFRIVQRAIDTPSDAGVSAAAPQYDWSTSVFRDPFLIRSWQMDQLEHLHEDAPSRETDDKKCVQEPFLSPAPLRTPSSLSSSYDVFSTAAFPLPPDRQTSTLLMEQKTSPASKLSFAPPLAPSDSLRSSLEANGHGQVGTRPFGSRLDRVDYFAGFDDDDKGDSAKEACPSPLDLILAEEFACRSYWSDDTESKTSSIMEASEEEEGDGDDDEDGRGRSPLPPQYKRKSLQMQTLNIPRSKRLSNGLRSPTSFWTTHWS